MELFLFLTDNALTTANPDDYDDAFQFSNKG